MKLIHDGMTATAVIPAQPEYHEEFTITYRPLAGPELDLWERAGGQQYAGLILDKLVSWPLKIADEQTAALISAEERKLLKVGDPLPMTATVLRLLPGFAFQCIRLAIMGILPQPSGKTGLETQQEALKN